MKSSFKRNVRFSEVDEYGELSLGKIVDYLQDCSNYDAECLGDGVERQMESGRAWVLSSWYIKINGKIRNKDVVQVSTWAYSFNKIAGERNYTIKFENEDNNVVEAMAVWVMFDINSQSLSRLTQADVERYELEPKLDMPKVTKKIIVGDNYEKRQPFRVHRYHLDINFHMNNAWYVKLAEEFIDKSHKENVRTIRVEYKKSAKYNDVIIPYVCENDDRCVIELRSEENNIFAIVEFTYGNSVISKSCGVS